MGSVRSTSRLAALSAALVVVLGSALTLGSCHEEAEPNAYGHTAPADRFALLTISYAEHRVPGGVTPQVHANGLFVRHVGVTRDRVLRVLNQPEVRALELSAPAPGECKLDQRHPVEISPTDQAVELLSAGRLRVEAGPHVTRLAEHTWPNIVPGVSGVAYEGTLPGAAAGALKVSGAGSRNVGRFLVRLEIPPVPQLASLNGEPITSTWADVPFDSELQVQWSVAEADPATAPPVYVELAVLHFDRTTSLVCAAADTGTFVLPREAVEQLGETITPDATVRLVTRRVSTASFAAPGLHTGEAVFVSRDAVLLR